MKREIIAASAITLFLCVSLGYFNVYAAETNNDVPPGLSHSFWKSNVGAYLGIEGEAYIDPGPNPAGVTADSMHTFLSQWTDDKLEMFYELLSTSGGAMIGKVARIDTANELNNALGLNNIR